MSGYMLSIILLVPASMVIYGLVTFGIIVPRGLKNIRHTHYRARIADDMVRIADGLTPHWTAAERAKWSAEMRE